MRISVTPQNLSFCVLLLMKANDFCFISDSVVQSSITHLHIDYSTGDQEQ